MNLLKCLIFFVSVLSASFAWPQFKPIENGPIHEAFATKTSGSVLLNSTQMQPPHPITEDAPPQVDSQTEWIHGYWAWFPERNNFIWISGVWRRPPPEHFWVHGFWREFDEGWVWIKGFWTKEEYE